MPKQFFYSVFALSLVLFVLAACDLPPAPTDDEFELPQQADLVPERREDSQGDEGFCNRGDSGSSLIILVRNQGAGDATSETTTSVDFGTFGTETVTTSPIPAGSMVDVSVPIPSGCFNSDCDFTITVDSNDDVGERTESNNAADGICIG